MRGIKKNLILRSFFIVKASIRLGLQRTNKHRIESAHVAKRSLGEDKSDKIATSRFFNKLYVFSARDSCVLDMSYYTGSHSNCLTLFTYHWKNIFGVRRTYFEFSGSHWCYTPIQLQSPILTNAERLWTLREVCR